LLFLPLSFFEHNVGRYYYNYSESKRDELKRLFGGIVDDIESIFFRLSPSSLESIFSKYGSKYGTTAERYARSIYPRWQNGEVRPNGQTVGRLLNLLPPHLSKEMKYDLMKKLRRHYIPRQTIDITTYPENWRRDVIPAIEALIKKGQSLKFPDSLYERASWLTNGDITAANMMLTAIEKEEAKIRTAYIEAEFKRIELLIQNIENAKRISHLIKLPHGDIHISIIIPRKPIIKTVVNFLIGGQKMEDKNHGEVERRNDDNKSLDRRTQKGSLLALTLQQLNPEQRKNLVEKIVDEKLRLDVSEREADNRFYNSTRDMASTIRHVKELEASSKSDYDIRSKHDTASGTTEIHVKKNNNTVIIVIAIVIGIIVFILTRR